MTPNTTTQANAVARGTSSGPKLWAEPAVALGATALVVTLLVLAALHAGPLWRDETISINLAQMPSWSEFWSNLRFDSFPALWLVVLRFWSFLGFAQTDLGIRVLGLMVGLFFMASLWLGSKSLGLRGPTLSLALMGTLPAFISAIGANRAYGLALGLLVLSMVAVWRVVESASRSRVLVALTISILYVHCVYYDSVFLAAILAAAGLVALQRRQWKTLGALCGIGLVAISTMAIYIPTMRRGALSVQLARAPFDFEALWSKLNEAVTARSSARFPEGSGPEIWVWLFILALGILAALKLVVRHRNSMLSKAAQKESREPAATDATALALFATLCMVFGVAGYLTFLSRLQLQTETWYYLGMLTLCAFCLDVTLGTAWRDLKPWGAARICFLILMGLWSATSVWEEAHTRHTNVDLIADTLSREAKEGDLIVVHSAWEGISFDRYYRGKAEWVTLPPITIHKVHRADLVYQMLTEADPIGPVLQKVDRTLQAHQHVWVVGHLPWVRIGQNVKPLPSPPCLPTKWWLGPYFSNWSSQVVADLLSKSGRGEAIAVQTPAFVNCIENLPVRRFEAEQGLAGVLPPRP